ncbi:MAG: hypothetical protein K5872_11940 [Rhizobiaceae bacterium]|nr:hypothetical protein [Rhizobiaceae bacterium]MCV0406926.1 hypothetical protein [Rhizobiaceae bacterium]
MRTVQTFTALAALGLLAGCVMGPVERRSPAVASQPTGVEGQWVDEQGVGVSTFAGGAFTTRALDTNSRLSEGSYRFVDNRTVSIEVRSLIRNTTSNVNCALATPNRLNCTNSEGNRFVLTRRSATG